MSMTPGRHLGDLPRGFDLDQMGELHQQGWDTINSNTYRVMVASGFEPEDFRHWPQSAFDFVLSNAPPWISNPYYHPLVDDPPIDPDYHQLDPRVDGPVEMRTAIREARRGEAMTLTEPDYCDLA
jgi:hypothetical protein